MQLSPASSAQTASLSSLFVVRCFADEFLLVRLGHATTSDTTSDTTCELARLALPAVGSRLLEAKLPCIADVIATEVELCIRLRAVDNAAEQVLQHLCGVLDSWGATSSAGRRWSLPVYFSTGDDWPAIQTASGLEREQIIERLLQLELALAMVGFLPGFAYLSGLPDDLHFERKSTPTTTTPAGSIAFGGRYLGVYSLPSPAGWNIVGLAGVRLLHFDRTPPLVLQPGDLIRLESIRADELSDLQAAGTTLQQWCGQ